MRTSHACGMWDLSSLDQKSNLCPLQQKRGVLTTGPPWKYPGASLKVESNLGEQKSRAALIRIQGRVCLICSMPVL